MKNQGVSFSVLELKCKYHHRAKYDGLLHIEVFYELYNDEGHCFMKPRLFWFLFRSTIESLFVVLRIYMIG